MSFSHMNMDAKYRTRRGVNGSEEPSTGSFDIGFIGEKHVLVGAVIGFTGKNHIKIGFELIS